MTFVPTTPAERDEMLARIGVSRFEELISAIPADLVLSRPLKVPEAHGEVELMRHTRTLLSGNLYIEPQRLFAGGGVYPHHVPAVVDELSSRGEFYTAYTPYQPEVSQGYLQCIYEYQTYICMLTGMEVSNASGYDMGTTMADALQMVKSHFKGRRSEVWFAPFVNPEAREVAATYNLGIGLTLGSLKATDSGRIDMEHLKSVLSENTGAVVFQYPDYLGHLEEELAEQIALVKAAGAAAIVSFYPYSAGLLRPPGELGADIVCGEAQCFGNYLSYGGPYCGFLACRGDFVRVLPGRLIGRTHCQRDGEPGEGFVMTLQAREQHIRRDKATSNICTNQALLALRVCIYLGAVGREGFRALAAQCHEAALSAFDQLTALPGVEPLYRDRLFFNEFTLKFPAGKAEAISKLGLERSMLAGLRPGMQSDGTANKLPEAAIGDCLTFAFTELHGPEEIGALISLVREAL